jgi:pilus assembly protein Flp/PilA
MMSPRLKYERIEDMLQQSRIFMRMVLQDEQGAVAIEYGLLAALVGVAIFTAAQLLGTNLGGLFDDIAGFLGSVGPIGP